MVHVAWKHEESQFRTVSADLSDAKEEYQQLITLRVRKMIVQEQTVSLRAVVILVATAVHLITQ